MLDQFCLASGLKVNIQKSKFSVSANMHRWKIDQFHSIMGIPHTYDIGKYLGFPLLKGRVTNANFSHILDRVNSRLAGLKSKLLCRTRRVTLAQSMLTSLLIYNMQNLWLPDGVCDKIDKSMRSFIWSKSSTHWVNLDTITRSRKLG